MTKIKNTRDTMSEIYFDALKIRNAVFIREQGISAKLEIENPMREAKAVHFVLYADDKAIATTRLMNEDSGDHLIQRMAVLKDFRGQGFASQLLEHIINFAREHEIPELILHSQFSARGLYEKFDFIAQGDSFEEAGIEHIEMRKKLS